jgi:hypothetical protein
MRAYSQDPRQQLLRAVDDGKSRAEIIDLFQVSQATIKRYVKQRRETGTVLPRPIPGWKKGAALRMGVQEFLFALVYVQSVYTLSFLYFSLTKFIALCILLLDVSILITHLYCVASVV